MSDSNAIVDKYRKDYIFFYQQMTENGEHMITLEALVGIKRGTQEIYYLYPNDTIKPL